MIKSLYISLFLLIFCLSPALSHCPSQASVSFSFTVFKLQMCGVYGISPAPLSGRHMHREIMGAQNPGHQEDWLVEKHNARWSRSGRLMGVLGNQTPGRTPEDMTSDLECLESGLFPIMFCITWSEELPSPIHSRKSSFPHGTPPIQPSAAQWAWLVWVYPDGSPVVVRSDSEVWALAHWYV